MRIHLVRRRRRSWGLVLPLKYEKGKNQQQVTANDQTFEDALIAMGGEGIFRGVEIVW